MSTPVVRHPVKAILDLSHNLEAEKSFLGSVILDNSVLDREILTPEDFHLQFYRQVYETMLEMWNERIGIDPVTLANRIIKSKIDLGGGRREFLDDLSWIVPTAANAKHYARILREQTFLRRARFLETSLSAAIKEEDPEKILRIQQRIGEMGASTPLESNHSIDAVDLSPTIPREHIVKDWIPRGIAIALYGPPGTGKSVFLTSMTVSIASGEPFYSLPTIQSGSVMYVSNEWPDKEEISRIWYEKTRQIPVGRLALEPSSPILEWVQTEKEGQRKEEWVWTAKGHEILRKIEKMKPDLIVLDTVLGLCSGIEQLNNATTYALGDLLQKKIASRFNAALIAVAHTNQASSKESLGQRLHYEAMAGGNGLPGAVRMAIGLTKVRVTDFGKGIENLTRAMVAVGASKFNVSGFRPCWTDENPGFFSWGQQGLEFDPNPRSATLKKGKDEEKIPVDVDCNGRRKYPEGGDDEDSF
jgi:hypothetical protein